MNCDLNSIKLETIRLTQNVMTFFDDVSKSIAEVAQSALKRCCLNEERDHIEITATLKGVDSDLVKKPKEVKLPASVSIAIALSVFHKCCSNPQGDHTEATATLRNS